MLVKLMYSVMHRLELVQLMSFGCDVEDRES